MEASSKCFLTIGFAITTLLNLTRSTKSSTTAEIAFCPPNLSYRVFKGKYTEQLQKFHLHCLQLALRRDIRGIRVKKETVEKILEQLVDTNGNRFTFVLKAMLVNNMMENFPKKFLRDPSVLLTCPLSFVRLPPPPLCSCKEHWVPARSQLLFLHKYYYEISVGNNCTDETLRIRFSSVFSVLYFHSLSKLWN